MDGLSWAPDPQSVSAKHRTELLRAALAVAPEAAERRSELAWEYFRLGDLDRALEVAGEAVDPPAILHLRGLCEHARGRFSKAQRLLSAACAQGIAARADLAEAMAYAGDDRGASGICLELLEADPNDVAAFRVECGRLLRAGDAHRLNQLCDELASRGATYAGLTAAKIAAMALLGDTRPAEQAQDYGARLWVGRLDMPQGFETALAAEILNHPNRGGVTLRRATVGGERVESPLSDAAPRLHALAEAIQGSVERYLTVPGADAIPDDVLAGERQLRLNLWAVILGEGGHQKWHIHPSALVSGVYYAAVPADGSDCADAGALEFDLISTDYDGRPVLPHRLRPETGTLVIFPSYFCHRTVPTRSPEPRIVVAFDVLLS